MSDTQAAMREFRFLDETRKSNGLTPAEEQRWYELAQGLGVDVGQPQAQGYYADDGNWYPYPEGYDPVTGQYAAAAPVYPPQYAPQNQGWYPPAQQQPQGYYGPDGNWYPYPPGYDPATGQYYPGYAPPQPSYPPPQAWGAPPPQAWPQQPQPQYDHATGQWSYPAYPPADYAATGQDQWPNADPESVTQSGPVTGYEAKTPAPAAADEAPHEVSTDEVMEVADDEVSPVPSAPTSSPSKLGEDPVAALRTALSLEELGEDEPTSVEPVAPRAPPIFGVGGLGVASKPAQASAAPALSLGDPEGLREPLPAPTDDAFDEVLRAAPTRVSPANALDASAGQAAAPNFGLPALEPLAAEPLAAPLDVDEMAPAPMRVSSDNAVDASAGEAAAPNFGLPALEPMAAKPLFVPRDVEQTAPTLDGSPTSPGLLLDAPVADAEAPTPLPFGSPFARSVGGAADEVSPPARERPLVDDPPDVAPQSVPSPRVATVPSALESLAIGPGVPLAEPELPMVAALAVEPEPAPTVVRSAPSGFTDWSNVPIVESPAMQVFEAQKAELDDQPIPEEKPVELGGESTDPLPLATSSEFVSYSNRADQLEVNLDEDSGEFEVDSSPLASLATGTREAPAEPVAQERLELASNAEFIENPELTGTGERWSSDQRSVPMSEDDGDIVQGIVLEDDAPALSPPRPKNTELEWDAAPSRPPMPFARISQIAAALPPAPAPVVPEPLTTRVATPIASRPSPVPAMAPTPVTDPFDRSGLSVGVVETVQILVEGEHRVILHTVEGQVKRGSIRDANLGGDILVLEGAAVENLPRARVKAIFFMLAPGGRAPGGDGEKVRVTFKDGRQVAGFSKDQKNATLGFFVVPADNRTNTERIFIYRHAVQNVVVEG